MVILWTPHRVPGLHLWPSRRGVPEYDYKGGGRSPADRQRGHLCYHCEWFYFSFSLSAQFSHKTLPKCLHCLSLSLQISAHKTNQAFGAAQLAMDAEEYGWLEEFLSMRSTLVGGKDAHYFFFTSKPSSCKNLNQYFQEAWAGMGLPGTPTFTDVRTSIATHVSIPVHVSDVCMCVCVFVSNFSPMLFLLHTGKEHPQPRRLV